MVPVFFQVLSSWEEYYLFVSFILLHDGAADSEEILEGSNSLFKLKWQGMITRSRCGITSCIGVCLHFLDTLITYALFNSIMSTHGLSVLAMIRQSEYGIGSPELVFLCSLDTTITSCVPYSIQRRILLSQHPWIKLFVFGILVPSGKRRLPLQMTSCAWVRWMQISLVELMLLWSMSWKVMIGVLIGHHSIPHSLWSSLEQTIDKWNFGEWMVCLFSSVSGVLWNKHSNKYAPPKIFLTRNTNVYGSASCFQVSKVG